MGICLRSGRTNDFTLVIIEKGKPKSSNPLISLLLPLKVN